MKTVTFCISTGEVQGLMVKENTWTFWAQLPDGNIIKRHKVKHIYPIIK